VKFVDHGERPIAWKVPDGWSEEAGGQMRFATLKSEGKDHLELTVTKPRPRRRGGVAERQPLARPDRPRAGRRGGVGVVLRELTVGGEKATVIDLTGTGADTSAMTAPAPVAPPVMDREPSRSGGLKYVAPAGWTERPRPTASPGRRSR